MEFVCRFFWNLWCGWRDLNPHANFKMVQYLFLRVAYTAISASQHSKNTNDCMPMCDKLCPNARGGVWATLPLVVIDIPSLPVMYLNLQNLHFKFSLIMIWCGSTFHDIREKLMLKLLTQILFFTALTACGSVGDSNYQSLTNSDEEQSTVISSSSSTYQRIGNTTFGSDGTSYQRIGNTTFSSDGTTYQLVDRHQFSMPTTTL